MSSSRRINIDTSLYLATTDFKIVGDVDYGEFGAGRCTEGHPIRYGIEVEDGEENVYVYGNTCIYKPFVLKHWNLKPKMLEDENVAKAGRNLYIIARDELADYVNEVPHPKDFDYNFGQLNKELIKIVKKAKIQRNTVLKEQLKQAKFRKQYDDFNKKNREQALLLKKLSEKVKQLRIDNKLGLLSKWEKTEFIPSIVSQHKNLRILSEKQLSIIQRIIDYKIAKVTGLDIEVSKAFTRILKPVTFKKLDQKNKDFILSLQNYFYKYGQLTPKQLKVFKRILSQSDGALNKYKGMKVNPWLIEQKTGFDDHGYITEIEVETEKALLCIVKLQKNGEFKGWIPKKMIIEN